MTTTSTITAADEPKIETGNRSIEYVWTLGQRQLDSILGDGEIVDVCVVLDASHYDSDGYHGQLRKSYVSTLRREERTDHSRRFSMGGPHHVPSVRLIVEPCPRFNQRKFEEFAERALEALRGGGFTPEGAAGIDALFTL